MITIALRDDLQLLLRRKVETGEFPTEEAVVEQALEYFLFQEPFRGRSHTNTPLEILKERLPGPFLEDDTVTAPAELPRAGREIACTFLHDRTRQPDLFPGE